MIKLNAYIWTFCAVCWFWLSTLVNGHPIGASTLAVGVGCSALAIYYTWQGSKPEE